MSPNVPRNYPPQCARSHTPSWRDYGVQSSSPLEPVGIAISMVGNYIQVKLLELHMNSRSQLQEHRQKYEHGAQQLSAELSVQVAQPLNYAETEQRACAQACLSTLEKVWLSRNISSGGSTGIRSWIDQVSSSTLCQWTTDVLGPSC